MIIYSILNKINNKRYIGQTIHTLKQRIDDHFKSAFVRNNRRPLYNAIRKYGVDNFEITAIDTTDDIDILNKKEIYYIKLCNCIHPSGYNMNTGGRNSISCKRTRDKIATALVGVLHTNERRRNISISHLGQVAWNKNKTTKTDSRLAEAGKKISKTITSNLKYMEQAKQLGLSRRGIKLSYKRKMSVPVWNKNKTKETDSRLAESSKNSIGKHSFKHTKEAIEKIRSASIEYWHNVKAL